MAEIPKENWEELDRLGIISWEGEYWVFHQEKALKMLLGFSRRLEAVKKLVDQMEVVHGAYFGTPDADLWMDFSSFIDKLRAAAEGATEEDE